MLTLLFKISTSIINYCSCFGGIDEKKWSLYPGPIRNVSKAIWCCQSSVPNKRFSAVQYVAFPAFSVYQTHQVFGFPCMPVPNCCIEGQCLTLNFILWFQEGGCFSSNQEIIPYLVLINLVLTLSLDIILVCDSLYPDSGFLKATLNN